MRTLLAFSPFWISLIVGAILTGKAADLVPSEAEVPALEASTLAVDDPSLELAITAQRDGVAPLRLALTPPTNPALLTTFMRWLDGPPTLIVVVTIADGEGDSREIQFDGSRFEQLGSHDGLGVARLILAESEIKVTKDRKYRFKARIEENDAIMSALEPVLIVGRPPERVLPTAAVPRFPGALLLLGMMGALSHVALLFGRLAVPFSDALAPDPLL